MASLMRRSLTVRTSVILLAIALVPVIILGAMSYMSSRAALIKQITQDLKAISEGKEQSVVQYLQGVKIETAVYAHAQTIINALIKIDNKTVDAPEAVKGINDYLEERLKINPMVQEFMIMDKQGTIVACTNKKEAGLDKSKDPYFMGAQQEDFFIRDIYQSKTTGKIGFVCSAQIKDLKTGEFLGVFAERLELNVLNEILADRSGLGESGENYLVNKDCYMVTESRFEKDVILKQKVDSEPVKYFHERGKNMASVYRDYSGHRVLGASSGEILKKTFGCLGWVVVSEMNAREGFAPVMTLGLRIVLVGILISVCALIVGIFLARGIAHPIKEIASSTQKLAEGDLTVRVAAEREDEIGTMARAFNATVAALRDIVSRVLCTAERVSMRSQQLSSSAEKVNATTDKVSSTVQQIAKGAESTAHLVEETSRAMERMSSSVDQVAANAQQAMSTSVRANQDAQKGWQEAQAVVEKMDRIYKTVFGASEIVRKLGERSEQINEIVTVITEIADQTNLLALNAAIEAARAGEMGRGFAVVAEEVRNLAEASAKAAEEIAGMIKNIQKATSQAVNAMDTGSKEVAEGREAVANAGQTFQEIVRSAAAGAGKVEQISAATQQMAAGTKQVVKSVDDIASTAEEAASATEEAYASTEEMSASVQEMTESAQELAKMAIELRDLVGRFKVDGEAAPAREAVRATAAPPVREMRMRGGMRADRDRIRGQGAERDDRKNV